MDAVAAADGFAVGRTVRVAPAEAPASRIGCAPPGALRDAIAHARGELERLVDALPAAQAELFDPERRILDEIAPKLMARAERGDAHEEAVVAETSCGCTDLVMDLRVRLLHALEPRSTVDLGALAARYGGGLVLVVDVATPSLVATLPSEVVGVVGAVQGDVRGRRDVGRTSHAAILARGRGVPLVYVTSESLASVQDGSWMIVDAHEGGASVRVEPGPDEIAAARCRSTGNEETGSSDRPLAHLGIETRVNVASPSDPIPDAADGVGLVRTEMMFVDRLTPPSESEQLAALLLIAAKARGRPIVARLFDAGGDKPLAWLGGASGSSRGIRRLLAHPGVAAAQLRAMARAREHADVRVLLPFVQTPADVNAVRALAPPSLPLGAMIESPEAVELAASIADASDFVSIGTNDLTATTLGLDRTMAAPELHPRVLRLVRRVIAATHERGRKVTICGEMVARSRGARVAVGLGADALSVAPASLIEIRRALGRATVHDCRAEAERALDEA